MFTFKNIIILLVGIILGYFIKGQAVQNFTMGYDDYKIVVKESSRNNINQEKVINSDQNIK